MKLGYCSNGLSHHRIAGGLDLLTSIGYRTVSIVIDHGWLAPTDPDLSRQREETRDFLLRNQVDSVIEGTGPFVLDDHTKHAPSLVDADTRRSTIRIEYIKHCIEIAKEFDSRCVSITSGVKPAGLSYSSAIELFVQNLEQVTQYADELGIWLAIEPTPGMLIDNSGRFDRLLHLSKNDNLKITLDIGQLFCLSEVPIANFIERWKDRLVNIHLCDVKVGKAEHLLFGDGQIYLPPILEALKNIDYQHGVHIELDRHGHDGANVARKTYAMIEPVFSDIVNSDRLP